MAPISKSEKRYLAFRIQVFLYILYIFGYFTGILTFALEFDNYWATGGFCFVILFICIRAAIFFTPPDRLYAIFPAGSIFRFYWQWFFVRVCLACIAVGLWLFYKGLHNNQGWNGRSYFCGMIGVFMMGKWAFLLTLPIAQCRPETLDEQCRRYYGWEDDIEYGQCLAGGSEGLEEEDEDEDNSDKKNGGRRLPRDDTNSHEPLRSGDSPNKKESAEDGVFEGFEDDEVGNSNGNRE